MNKVFTLIVYLLVATALFNQINAQVPYVKRNAEFVSNAGNLEADYSLVGLDFYSTLNKQTLKQPKLKVAPAGLELLDSIVYLEIYDGAIYGGDKQVWEYDSYGNAGFYNWYYWESEAQVWMGRQRVDSTFDANGRLSMIIKDSWDRETRQWKTGNKTELSYNSNGDLILYADYWWNADTKEWVWKSKSESTHSYADDGSHSFFSINYTYNNETGEWTPHHRNQLNYDSNGKQTLYNASFLDSASNTWVFRTGSFKYENSYNEQGNRTLSSYYLWSSELNQWKGQGNLVESDYDSIGNLLSRVIKIWDVSLNQWVNNSKSEFNYNEHGLIMQQIDFQLDSLTNVWVAFNKTENKYNENGDVAGIIKSQWYNEDSLWFVTSQNELLYDAHGNLSKYQVLALDTISNEWTPVTIDEYTYDANNHETLKEHYERNDDGQLVLVEKTETAYDVYGNEILNAFYELDEQSGELIKSNDAQLTYNDSGNKLIEYATSYYYDGIPYILKTNYYYSIHSLTSINSNPYIKKEVVYPNPFNDQLSFQLNNNNQFVFELFNFQGQKVLSKWVQNSETIDVVSLPQGVYLYTLSLDNNIYRGKLIKK